MKNCDNPIQLSLFPALEAPHLDWFSDVPFNEPHKPLPGQKFAYITEAHDAAMRRLRLTPSAQLLYRYLLRLDSAGKELETSLDEFRTWTISIGRAYSLRQVRRAFTQLVDTQLVSVTKRYLGGIFRLIVRHIGAIAPNSKRDKKDPPVSPTTEERPKCHKKEGETPIPPSPLTDTFKRKTDNTAAAGKRELPEEELLPINEEDEGRASENDSHSQNPDEEAILIAVRAEMGMNPQLRAEVLKYTLVEVEAALRLYTERKEGKPIRDPQGWLTEALRGRWALEEGHHKAAVSRYPEELETWYEWATQEGIVDGKPLEHCTTDRSGEIQVSVFIPEDRRRPGDHPYTLLYWRDAMECYPIPDDEGWT